MKTFRVQKPCDPQLLGAAILAATGLPATIRSSQMALGEPSLYGVVAVDDSVDSATVVQIIAAHTAKATPSRTPSPAEISSSMTIMEKL